MKSSLYKIILLLICLFFGQIAHAQYRDGSANRTNHKTARTKKQRSGRTKALKPGEDPFKYGNKKKNRQKENATPPADPFSGKKRRISRRAAQSHAGVKVERRKKPSKKSKYKVTRTKGQKKFTLRKKKIKAEKETNYFSYDPEKAKEKAKNTHPRRSLFEHGVYNSKH